MLAGMQLVVLFTIPAPPFVMPLPHPPNPIAYLYSDNTLSGWIDQGDHYSISAFDDEGLVIFNNGSSAPDNFPLIDDNDRTVPIKRGKI